MTTYLQDPERLDTNVTIKMPEKIVVEYVHPKGWAILLDGNLVGTITEGGTDYVSDHPMAEASHCKYFADAGDATDWLIKRDLLKTKAYAELHKKVKKAKKKEAKET
jgi:hypothetical protein